MLGQGAWGSAKKCPLPGVPYSGKKLYFGYHWNRIMSRTFWRISTSLCVGQINETGQPRKTVEEENQVTSLP
jgi:hypothetical protein